MHTRQLAAPPPPLTSFCTMLGRSSVRHACLLVVPLGPLAVIPMKVIDHQEGFLNSHCLGIPAFVTRRAPDSWVRCCACFQRAHFCCCSLEGVGWTGPPSQPCRFLCPVSQALSLLTKGVRSFAAKAKTPEDGVRADLVVQGSVALPCPCAWKALFRLRFFPLATRQAVKCHLQLACGGSPWSLAFGPLATTHCDSPCNDGSLCVSGTWARCGARCRL